MSDFPPLVPSAAPITPGTWAAASHQALNGSRSTVRLANVETGRRLRLTFDNIIEQEYLWVRNHYRGHRSRFDAFVFTTTTLAAALTPAGMAWRWAAQPRVYDKHADMFSVECEFICVPRPVKRIPGANWVSGPSALTRGAWSGIVPRFPTGVSWVSGASTLSRGLWALTESDPDFANVVLLLHMEGSNGSTSIVDSGPLGLTITTSNGSLSTAQSAIGSSSFYVPSSSQGQINLPVNSALVLDGDFTIEWRVRHSSLSGKQQYFCNFNGTNVQIAYQGGLYFYPANATRTLSLAVDTWAALAITRSGSTVRWFKDGVLLGSATDTNTYSLSGGNVCRNGSENFLGYFDEVRITKSCRYTDSYTVRTTPFPDS